MCSAHGNSDRHIEKSFDNMYTSRAQSAAPIVFAPMKLSYSPSGNIGYSNNSNNYNNGGKYRK